MSTPAEPPVIDDAELAVAAARVGAAIVRRRYRTPLVRQHARAGDVTTDVDLEAEQAIADLIRHARPEDAITGEESGASPPGRARRRWLIDPVCGTRNYAADTPLVAVNIALTMGDTIAVAAVADPMADEVMWTDGRRALHRTAGSDAGMQPSAESRLVDVNLDHPVDSAEQRRAVGLLADPVFARSFSPRVTSTTLALAWVACGRRAAYVTQGDLRNSVHSSAGIALCVAAGCVVTGVEGQPLHTGAAGLIAAADATTHAALCNIMRRQYST